MALITRKILKPNFTLTVDNDVYDYEYIIHHTDIAKTFLLNKGAIRGQKVLLLAPWPNFLCWFIAGAELGLSFVVADPGSDSYDEILKLYGTIDFTIDDKFYLNAVHSGDYCYAKDDDILIYTTSSGSTGQPKVITYTHDFLAKLAERNVKVYNLKETDRCAHTKTLTHSSIVGIYFLPTLLACSNHYYFEKEFPQQLVNHKIQYCPVLRHHLTWLYNEFNNDIDYNFTIFVISRIPTEYKLKLVNEYVKMVSVFGTSETMGPLFLSEINNDNKTNHYNNNFNKPLDDFYGINITPTALLTVTMPDGSEIVTGDAIYINENFDYIFSRREDRYIINNEVLYLSAFDLNLKKILNVDYDLVADEKTNQIYIRIDEAIDLDNLNIVLTQAYSNKSYYISKQLIGSRAEYMNDVKLDANLIRIRCRELD